MWDAANRPAKGVDSFYGASPPVGASLYLVGMVLAGTFLRERALVLLFLLVKMASKFVGVRPLAHVFQFAHRSLVERPASSIAGVGTIAAALVLYVLVARAGSPRPSAALAEAEGDP